MSLRANFEKNYLLRYLAFFGVTFFFCLYFAYDGFIGYPSKLVIIEAYEKLEEIDDPKEKKAQWTALAKSNGWSTKVPEKSSEEMRSDIVGQYIFGAACIPIWVTALIYYFRCRGSWIERTESGLKTSWGESIDFTKVQKFDKTKWERKGIAKATYFREGIRKIFVFDNYKFERTPLDRIVYELEQVMPKDQIVGGPPEPAPTENKEAEPVAESTEAQSETAS
jgi:hypothetical protein